jgi:hypothetical protein
MTDYSVLLPNERSSASWWTTFYQKSFSDRFLLFLCLEDLQADDFSASGLLISFIGVLSSTSINLKERNQVHPFVEQSHDAECLSPLVRERCAVLRFGAGMQDRGCRHVEENEKIGFSDISSITLFSSR